jgi:DNA uptake protein ComE-like DNA-binding protein
MNPPLTRRLVAAACGIGISLAFLLAPAVAADGSSRNEQLLLWLLGLKTAREHERPRVDVNAATVQKLQEVPGVMRDQALRIIAERPYATLQDLARSGLSPIAIERLTPFLVVDPSSPSALPGPGRPPSSR